MAQAAEVVSRHPTAQIGVFELRQVWDGRGPR